MPDAVSPRPPRRLARLGAGCVNLAPLLGAGLPFGGAYLGGETGKHMLGLMFVLGGFGVVGSVVMLVTNAFLLLRQGRTLGLAYFGLAIETPNSMRVLLAELAVLLVPWLLGGLGAEVVFETVGNDQELQLAVLLAVASACYAANWLTWLRRSATTLGDRLGGGRVVTSQAAPPQRLWPDVALVSPPALFAWAYADIRGVALGGIVGTLVMAFPVTLKYLRK